MRSLKKVSFIDGLEVSIDPPDWNVFGKMDFVLDGHIVECQEATSDVLAIFTEQEESYIYSWRPLNEWEEVEGIETQEDLGEELCDYCPLENHLKGVRCYGGQPVMCEGSHCKEAHTYYLDNFLEERLSKKEELSIKKEEKTIDITSTKCYNTRERLRKAVSTIDSSY